jgi:hypothetical protein
MSRRSGISSSSMSANCPSTVFAGPHSSISARAVGGTPSSNCEASIAICGSVACRKVIAPVDYRTENAYFRERAAQCPGWRGQDGRVGVGNPLLHHTSRAPSRAMISFIASVWSPVSRAAQEGMLGEGDALDGEEFQRIDGLVGGDGVVAEVREGVDLIEADDGKIGRR